MKTRLECTPLRNHCQAFFASFPPAFGFPIFDPGSDGTQITSWQVRCPYCRELEDVPVPDEGMTVMSMCERGLYIVLADDVRRAFIEMLSEEGE